MQKIYKGVSKIVLLIIIFVLLVISAIIFGYSADFHNVKEDAGEKTKEIISDTGEIVTEKVIEEGQEAIGKKLKETGEKMLEE